MKHALLAGVATALAAAMPTLAQAETVEVRLSSFDFTPKTIHLRAGQPVTLHLVNTSSGGHNFSAPQFFAAARQTQGPVRGGAVDLRSHGTADITLVPAAGTYRLRCTHPLHTAFGMRGSIVVD